MPSGERDHIFSDMQYQDFNLILGKAHSRQVECPILTTQSAQSQVKLLDQPDLRYARVVAIETYTVVDKATSDPSNYTVINGVDLSKISLVLETNDADDTGHYMVNDKGQYVNAKGQPLAIGEKPVWVPAKQALGNGRFTSTQQNVKFIPLASLHRICNYGSPGNPSAGPDPYVRDLMTFYNMYVSWDKCYLQIINGGLGNAVNKAVILQVYYSWLDINGVRIERT